MERPITGFHHDDEGDWVAELACGHNQHVRHRPPFQMRPWAVDAAGRASRIGTSLDCPLCDRAELPGDLEHVRTTPRWDEGSVPAGLLRSHRTAAGTWGLLTVHRGRLRFGADTEPPIHLEVVGGSSQPIPPEVVHRVTLLGPVEFSIDFLSVLGRDPRPQREDRSADTGDVPTGDDPGGEPVGDDPAGGDPACWAGLLCPECGAMVDGGPHHH